MDLTQSVLMGDGACTAASSLTVRVTIGAVAKVDRIIELWVLRGACLWAMERLLQLPP